MVIDSSGTATRPVSDRCEFKIQPGEIAFDVDGVVADTFRTFVDTARRDFGYDFTYEDITDYDFRSVIKIDDRASNTIIRRILEDPVGCGIEPIPGAPEVLTRLSRTTPLLFVTARPESAAIRIWLQKQLPGVPEMRIHVVATGRAEDKLEALRELGVSYFVEDRLETGFMLESLPLNPIIFDQPWNRKPHPFTVVENWQQIDAHLDWS